MVDSTVDELTPAERWWRDRVGATRQDGSSTSANWKCLWSGDDGRKETLPGMRDLVWSFSGEYRTMAVLNRLIASRSKQLLERLELCDGGGIEGGAFGDVFLVPREPNSGLAVCTRILDDGWVYADVTWPFKLIFPKGKMYNSMNE